MTSSRWPWPVVLYLGVLVAVIILVPFRWLIGGVATLLFGIYVYSRWRAWWLRARFRARWATEGKDLIIVTSDSPHWKEYIATRWLPLLGHRAVVLNSSERSRWREQHPLEGAIATRWGGAREFNPMVLFIPPRGPIQEFRFWEAFRDYKHGKPRLLRAEESALGSALGVTFPET